MVQLVICLDGHSTSVHLTTGPDIAPEIQAHVINAILNEGAIQLLCKLHRAPARCELLPQHLVCRYGTQLVYQFVQSFSGLELDKFFVEDGRLGKAFTLPHAELTHINKFLEWVLCITHLVWRWGDTFSP